MAVVTVSGYAPRDYRRRTLLLLVLALFGLMTFAAIVAPTKIDCRDELLAGGGALLTGGGALLTTGRQQCLVLGELAVPLPAWAQAMARVL